MNDKPRFKAAYVPWWRPIRLAQRHENGFDFIGWVWRERAFMVNNLNHGWIAFVDDQTPEKLNRCFLCGK